MGKAGPGTTSTGCCPADPCSSEAGGYGVPGASRPHPVGDRVGGYALAGAYGAVDRESFIDLLRRSYDLGVTFFDTAGNYGDAEAVLGETVHPFRDEVILATKVGSPEGAPPCLDREAVEAACRRSLRSLGTDRIDLLQVHFYDPGTPVEETVAALEGLRAAGLIRHYGVGHLPGHRVARYLEVGGALLHPDGTQRRGSGVAAHFAASLRRDRTGRHRLQRHRARIVTGTIGPKPAFEQGDIRNFDPLFQRARLASGRRIAEHLGSLARALGRTPAQLAIAWVLAQPGIACALTGPRRLAHLEENLEGRAGACRQRRWPTSKPPSPGRTPPWRTRRRPPSMPSLPGPCPPTQPPPPSGTWSTWWRRR